MRTFRLLGTATLAALAMVAIAGCAQKSPEERVAEVRSRYRAELNGFIVRETPVEPAPVAEEAVPEGEAAPEGEAEPAADGEPGGEAAAPEPVELERTVLLDILVQHDAQELLPGVTVDVTMASRAGEEKGRWLLWIDTAGLAKATAKQVSHELEGVPFEEGDGFHAEVRHPVPPDERAGYREFSTAASGG